MIEEAYAEGIRRFGENKPQELRDKYEEMEKDIKWHMIGHLQRNKVKYMTDWMMVRCEAEWIIVLPAVGRLAGQYPSDYKGDGEE